MIDERVTVEPPGETSTATFHGSAGAAVRLLSGRLGPKHSAGLNVDGNVTLDELRRVFPGY